MNFGQAMKAKLIQLRVAREESIVGCTDEQIHNVMTSQQVSRLPEVYRQFLSTMGQESGLLYTGAEASYKDLLDLKQAAKELVSKTSFVLPEDAFVFLMWQGYEFFYFLTQAGDDPPVYMYVELDDKHTIDSPSISAFLTRFIEESEGKEAYQKFLDEFTL